MSQLDRDFKVGDTVFVVDTEEHRNYFYSPARF